MQSYKLITEQPNYDIEFITEEQNRSAEKKMFAVGDLLMLNLENRNHRRYLEEDMLPEIKRYVDESVSIGRGVGELNHCVPDTYKILTDKGWKLLKDISNTETVATLNTNTEEIEYSQIKEKIHNYYSGDMIRIQGRNINMLSTPSHRILLKDRTKKYWYPTAEYLLDNLTDSVVSHSYIPKTGDYLKPSPKVFTLKGIEGVKKLGNYTNDITKDIDIDYNVFVSFLGLYLAEGHFNKGGRNYGVHISQIKEKFMGEIADLLALFPAELKWSKVSNGFVCYDRRLNDYVSVLGDCYSKYIPEHIKNGSSAEDLSSLVYWFNIGDGRFNLIHDKYHVRNVFTVSNRLIDDLNECLFKSGLSGNISVIAQKDSVIRGRFIAKENTKPLFLLNLSKTDGIYMDKRFITITRETFEGQIACVVTENSNWYCMDENGKAFWTGNSSKPDIDLDRIAHKIVTLERDEKRPNYFRGKCQILDTPLGKTLRTLTESGVVWGFSSKALGQLEESGNSTIVRRPSIVSIDAVFEPSIGEFSKGILENREYIIGDDGRVAEAYAVLDKKLSKYPSKHSDEIRAYILENLQKFLTQI